MSDPSAGPVAPGASPEASTSLRDRVALVTGGAGGIGSAICRRLAESGASVVVTYRSRGDRAEALARGLPGMGHVAAHVPVEDADAQAALAALVAERFGRLHVLVNNAAITKPVPLGDLEGLDDGLIEEIFRVNWRGAFATVRTLRRFLEVEPGGVVVNISSVAASSGFGSNVAYCASKAALDSMTRSLARALAPRIRAVSVSPGWVLGEYSSRMPAGALDAQRALTPLGRLARPEDVADAVLAAATLLRFTTGVVIPVDGGRPLGS